VHYRRAAGREILIIRLYFIDSLPGAVSLRGGGEECQNRRLKLIPNAVSASKPRLFLR
jgi:hypothetical protein